MSIKQLNFAGLDKIQVAIMRLKEFEPPDGYFLAFSGGKDSITIYDLAVRAGVKFDAHYSLTTVDPPELVHFIKDYYPQVEVERPPSTMWQLIYKKGLPRRNARWCCQQLKERGGSGRSVVTGIRWAESARRRTRSFTEICHADSSKRFLHPIIDWEDGDVWEYIGENELEYCTLYDEGFKRLGCVLCPMTRNTTQQIERWPKIARAWYKAAVRYFNRGTPGSKRFKTADDFWYWWLDRDAAPVNPDQCGMFV